MARRIPLIFGFLAALLLCSCSGSSDAFEVKGTIEDAPLKELRMVYYDGRCLQNVEVRTDDKGRFVTKGYAPSSVFVELYADAETQTPPIAVFIAENGQTVKVKGTVGSRAFAEIKGSKDNDLLYDFLARCGQLRGKSLNDSIAAFVGQHKASKASTVLMSKFYDHRGALELADSLFNAILPEARPLSLIEGYAEMLSYVSPERAVRSVPAMSFCGSNDSIMSFVPGYHSYNVLVFTEPLKPDSLTRFMRNLRSDATKRRLRIVEVCLWADSTMWRRAISRDSATWQQAWLPGGANARPIRALQLPSTPYIIVCDSSARRLYSGASVSEARRALTDRKVLQ